ncbi:TRAP transporter substrate-binding protein [Synergistaceae bacterium OttesenSCG-928-I11]|nr:TRAP transporter substrate-binding protein [Synergistaceae bacterium OttesenSCG-928-I11]
MKFAKTIAVAAITLLIMCGVASAELKVKHAMTVNMDDAGGFAAATMKENLEKWSNGNIVLQIFPGSQLGGMREHYEACQSGAIETVYVAASAASKFVPEIGILDLPFIFPTDYDKAWKVIDGKLTDYLAEQLAKKNFTLLGIAPYGYKVLHSAGKQIKSLGDIKGMKIRIMPSKTLELTYQAWNANPTPVEFGELYVALQQKIVDGGENGLSVIRASRFNEVQDYLTVSKHGLFVGLMVANKRWFDKLSDEDRELLIRATQENIQQQRAFVAEEDEKIITYLGENGMEVYRPNEAEIEEFKKASIPVHEEFAKMGKGNREVLDIVYEAIKELGY